MCLSRLFARLFGRKPKPVPVPVKDDPLMLQVNELSGFGAGGGNAPTSLSFVSSTTSAGSTITCPTVQKYDIGILWDVSGAADTPSTVLPSGWTAISNTFVDIGSKAIRSMMSYRIFDGSEDGSTITGMAGTDCEPKVLLLFRPNAGSVVSSLQLQSPWNEFSANSNPPAQTISASGQSAPLVRIAAAGRIDSSPSITLSGTFDAAVISQTDTGGARASIGYAVQNSAPSSDTGIDTNIASGAHSLVSGWFRCL